MAPDDLNLNWRQRLSVALVGLAIVFLLLAPFQFEILAFSATAFLAVAFLNRALYAFFFKQRGLPFAATCIPLHFLYYLYSGLSYLYVRIDFQLRRVAEHLPGAFPRD